MVVRRQWWGGMEKGIYDGEMLVHVLRSEIWDRVSWVWASFAGPFLGLALKNSGISWWLEGTVLAGAVGIWGASGNAMFVPLPNSEKEHTFLCSSAHFAT
jgi:hypothetical protein